MRKARAANEETPKKTKYIKSFATELNIESKFLFRGVNLTLTEYEEVEELTATSLNAEKASGYGGIPFMMIYVPNEKVFGLPICCSNKRRGLGTNKDAEILLVDPILQEIQDFTGGGCLEKSMKRMGKTFGIKYTGHSAT